VPIGVAWCAQDPKRLKYITALFDKETSYPPEQLLPSMVHNSLRRSMVPVQSPLDVFMIEDAGISELNKQE
jgi:hypothetical protein